MSYTKTLGLSEKLSGGELSAGQLGLLYSPCCLLAALPVAALHPLSTTRGQSTALSFPAAAALLQLSILWLVHTAAPLLCKWLRAVWGCSSSVCCLEAADRGAGGAGPSSATRQPDTRPLQRRGAV